MSEIVTVASPLCSYERCTRKGRAVLGPPEIREGCINRSIRCLTCGATGEESRNTEIKASKRKQAAA